MKYIENNILEINKKYCDGIEQIIKFDPNYKSNVLMSDEINEIRRNYMRSIKREKDKHDTNIESLKSFILKSRLIKSVVKTFTTTHDTIINERVKKFTDSFESQNNSCKRLSKILWTIRNNIYNDINQIKGANVMSYINLESMKEKLNIKLKDIKSDYKKIFQDFIIGTPHSVNYKSPYYDKENNPLMIDIKKVSLNIEENMTYLKSKTCDIDTYKTYITYKNYALSGEYGETYRNKIFLKHKLYAYIDKQRTLDNMLNIIEAVYGPAHNIIIIYGDWSIGHQLKNCKPTPMISLKRKIHTRFKMYNIDEYKTSKIHHITHKECEKLELPDKYGKSRKMYAVLTSKMEGKMFCINRDLNAINNFKVITHECLNNNPRPEIFRRGPIKKLASNPRKECVK